MISLVWKREPGGTRRAGWSEGRSGFVNAIVRVRSVEEGEVTTTDGAYASALQCTIRTGKQTEHDRYLVIEKSLVIVSSFGSLSRKHELWTGWCK